MNSLLLTLLLSLSFSGADRLFVRESYLECRDSLTIMLPRAEGGKERAEVLWRLSRVTLLLGEKASSREEKRAIFGQGVRYASEGIAADPANVHCYMWHCANTGRECQTRGIKDQAAAVPVMEHDLETILDRYGRTDYSEAWQALSEIYHAHPFRSDDKAVAYARKAAETVPAREVRLTTYLHLAKLLYERNGSAAKRAAALASDAAKYRSGGSNTVRYGFYPGANGPGGKAPWTDRPLSLLSDREEAVQVAAFAMRRYEASSRHNAIDARDYQTLSALARQWGSSAAEN